MLNVCQYVVFVNLRTFGTRPNTVLENKAVLKATAFNQFDGHLKLFLRFTAEADNKVA